MGLNETLILIYIAGVIGCALAGDKRTVGLLGGLALGILTTPLVGAILILSWPTRLEAEAHFLKKKDEAQAGLK